MVSLQDPAPLLSGARPALPPPPAAQTEHFLSCASLGQSTVTKGTVRASRAGTQEGAIWEEPGPADPRSSSLQGMHEKLVLLAQQGSD